MAKYDTTLTGDFDHFLNYIEDKVLKGSLSAKFEDGHDYHIDDVKVAVRVFERYSMTGENRVSLNVTLVGKGNSLHLTAISSGGSQALFFKVNRFGESSFLKTLTKGVESYKRSQSY